jgi:hypothetical protein
MAISVRLPPRVEQRLAEYCATHKVSKSEAVKRALEVLLTDSGPPPDLYKSSARFRGSDATPGSVARDSRRLLKAYHRNKQSLG